MSTSGKERPLSRLSRISVEHFFKFEHGCNFPSERTKKRKNLSCTGYIKYGVLWIYVSGSVVQGSGIEPEAHLDDVRYHGDQNESKSRMVQNCCHVLLLW